MKKILLVALALSLFASASFADSASSAGGNLFLQVNGTISYATPKLGNSAPWGFGGNGSLGYNFGDNFELALESGYVTYAVNNLPSGISASFNYVPLLLKGQYFMGTDKIKPYVFAGAGLAFNSKSGSIGGFSAISSETDLLVEGGLGMSFAASDNVSVYLQAKGDFDFISANFGSDNPIIVFPINLGLRIGL